MAILFIDASSLCSFQPMAAFAAFTVADNDDEEEAHGEKDDFVNELKSIHKRKLVLQQKLENFHARQTICNELE
jgi:hypothetical protein